MRHSPEYNAYYHAKHRCESPKSPNWADYGGRGIEFRFTDFVEFFNEIGVKPAPAYELDRINTDGHYEAGNVRWVTKIVQANNKRTTPMITFQDKTQSLAFWCRELQLKYLVTYKRLFIRGWSVERAFTTPPMKNQFG